MKIHFVAIILVSTWAQGTIQTREVSYKQGGASFEGALVYDDAVSGKRPGVIVIHDWMGKSDFVQGRAVELAKIGYAAFVADIYGKGNRPKSFKQAGERSGKLKSDRPLLRARAQAALEQLAAQAEVDSKKVAAIGYCFGGTTALELARSGAPLAGAVSFHGGLSTPTPEDAKNIKGKILVLHGAADPHVPLPEVTAFEEEMDAAKVDWTLVKYSGAVHAFAVPTAGDDPSKGAAYNATADERSWQAMKDFFVEIFK
jgi:dienelactone hydrolase